MYTCRHPLCDFLTFVCSFDWFLHFCLCRVFKKASPNGKVYTARYWACDSAHVQACVRVMNVHVCVCEQVCVCVCIHNNYYIATMVIRRHVAYIINGYKFVSYTYN